VLSIREFQLPKIIKIIKSPESIKLSLIKISFGEKWLIPNIKKVVTITEITPTRVKHVLILSFFLSELGRYLINPVPKPNNENEVINDITEIIVVAIPTSSTVKSLAQIIQNTKPKTDIIPVLIIKNNELLYRESLNTDLILFFIMKNPFFYLY
jgi:hypothetical protein